MENIQGKTAPSMVSGDFFFVYFTYEGKEYEIKIRSGYSNNVATTEIKGKWLKIHW